ncbi:hypothetical protein EGW08_010477 [Elysia chlorotica]|uniref:Uncharacterized protein n=1 Tax=Elysia chlorotica TaxID=188477 RepID=A0A433TJU5_ELYCH|nr:hypothetical protein EGW08_010477 [Elysia chlorotica]
MFLLPRLDVLHSGAVLWGFGPACPGSSSLVTLLDVENSPFSASFSLVVTFCLSLGALAVCLNFAAWMRSFESFLCTMGASPVIVSSSFIGVDFMAPVITLVAWFCTLVILSRLDLAAVPHADTPYSRTGRTLPVYMVFRILALAPH